jgi:arylsulfatase A-like enzyme/Flp pilus assembly protein TadD
MDGSARRIMTWGTFILSLSLFGQSGLASKKESLNVLLITIDTLRPDRLSCYGSTRLQTPNIDGLARRGALFSRAFSHNPITLAAHVNILLGLTPPAHGVHDNSNFIVRDEFTTLAEWLKKAGYETGAVIGAFPLDSRFGLAQGFDLYDDNYGAQDPEAVSFVERRAEEVVDKAIGWLDGRTGPWFLWVHLFDPHQRYSPPEPFLSRFKDDLYSGEVAYVDQALGKLFSSIEAKGLGPKTITFITGDHGESLGEHGETTHGYFAYNATLCIPMIIAVPGAKPMTIPANVSHVDIFPTVCDLLGLEKPTPLHGRSLVPLLEGKKQPERDIYFEALTAYCNRGWAPLRGFISRNSKFMESPLPELYDLEKDFGETRNLAESQNVKAQRDRFNKLFAGLAIPGAEKARQEMDAETREKLRSLGYLASPQTKVKTEFTAADDLKTLLPYHTKWMQATVAQQSGRLEEAMTLLREVIAERKDFDLAYTYLANYLKEAGRGAEAVEVLKEALEANPESVRLITSYGITLVEEGKPEEAIRILKRGIALIDYDPENWNYLGVAYWNMGRFGDALSAYEKALSLDQNNPIVFNNIGTLHLSMYLKNKDAGDLSKAVKSLNEAIRLDPRYASALNGLGMALKMQGDMAGAIGAWKKAVELKPGFGYPLYNLGLTYLAMGNKPEALGYFLRCKEKTYDTLPPGERVKLDRLIESCRE